MEDQDSILDALEKIKEWAMKHMGKGDAPLGEAEESPEMEMEEHEGEMPDELMDEMPIEEEEEPKSTVLKRYDFSGGGGSKPKEAPLPFKRGRGRPKKVR